MSQLNINIHEAICRVMQDVGSVSKGRKNAAQGYSYRGVADVTRACQLVMAKHNVHVTPEEVTETRTQKDTKSGGRAEHVVLKVRFRLYAGDGSYVDCTTIGEAIDSGDKAAAKAMAVSLKYCLTQCFLIPEEDPELDIESASPEIAKPAKASLPIVPAAKEAAPASPPKA